MGKEEKFSVTEDSLLIYASYTQIAVSLQHYNRIQTTYRTFASTWLLATFIGIGYSLSSLEVNLPFHPLIIVAFICLASSSALSLVWYMDLIICEQFIASLVIEGIELEKNYDWLPSLYHNVNKMKTLLSYVNLKGIFYVGCFAILLITMGTSLTLYTQLKYKNVCIAIPFITLLSIIGINYLIIYSMQKNDPYRRLQKIKREKIG